jgi:hypothetical protein
MFRFSIRDLLWLMVIVGFCLHAWTERFSRDVAWSRRVREEVLERADAQKRAKEAEKKTSRYANIIWQLQIELIQARYAARIAQAPADPPPIESQPPTTP